MALKLLFIEDNSCRESSENTIKSRKNANFFEIHHGQ